MDNNNKYNSKKDENIWRFGRVSGATNFGFTKCTGLYKCILCNHMAEQWLNEAEKDAHGLGSHHSDIAIKLAIGQMKRIDDLTGMDGVKYDLQRLGYAIPDSIKELFVKYFMDEGTNQTYWIEARQLCDSYMTKEPLVLLELALWKNACLCNPSSQEDFTASGMVQFFLCGGWKKNKTASRHNQLIEIVLTNVLPFLGFRHNNKIIATGTKKRKLSSA